MAIHAEAISGLAPADYRLIETEHLRLRGTINNLRDTCHNMDTQRSCMECSREKLGTCRGRLVSFFYNIMDFSTNHFRHEEFIMQRWLRHANEYEDFVRHQHAHRGILRDLAALIGEGEALDARGETAAGYRRVYAGIWKLFEEHERLFDDPFILSTQRGGG